MRPFKLKLLMLIITNKACIILPRTVFEEPLEVSESQLYAFRTLIDQEGNKMVNNFRWGNLYT